MAAVPSIIYGLWGFFLAAAARQRRSPCGCTSTSAGSRSSASTPTRTPPSGSRSRYTASAFIAGHRRGDDGHPDGLRGDAQVFSQAPPGEREAAFALGATHWGVVRTVVLPFGKGGIIGGTMLGLGRALGETIAVLLIISPSFDLKIKPLEIGTNSISR